MQSAVLAMIDSVSPSLCLCARPSHAGINHAKMTPATIMRSSRQDSLMSPVSSWLTSARNAKGNIGSEGAEWERGRKNRQFVANKSPYLKNGARKDHTCSHNDGLIGSGIRAFDWYQNHRPWMTLNGQKAHSCRKDASFGAHCTNLNENRPILSVTKSRPMNLVSGNIRRMRIFAEVPLGGGFKSEWGWRRRQLLAYVHRLYTLPSDAVKTLDTYEIRHLFSKGG